jgi:hypothetical protein
MIEARGCQSASPPETGRRSTGAFGLIPVGLSFEDTLGSVGKVDVADPYPNTSAIASAVTDTTVSASSRLRLSGGA